MKSIIFETFWGKFYIIPWMGRFPINSDYFSIPYYGDNEKFEIGAENRLTGEFSPIFISKNRCIFTEKAYFSKNLVLKIGYGSW